MIIKRFLIGSLVFLLLLPTAFAYQTYIGIKFTSVGLTGKASGNFGFLAGYTNIVIPDAGYNEPINPDANGKWEVGETTYTDLVDLTEGQEYTVQIEASRIRVDEPRIGGDYVRGTQCTNWCNRCFGSGSCVDSSSTGDEITYPVAAGCTKGSGVTGQYLTMVICGLSPTASYSINFFA